MHMTVPILLDGSNIVFWRGGQAQGDVAELVTRALLVRRFGPVIYFDNSIDQHMTQQQIEILRDLAGIVVAPRGVQADGLLLEACKQGRIQIVSNDRFRVWRSQYPKLRNEWLVTGSVGKGGRVSFSKKLRPAPL